MIYITIEQALRFSCASERNLWRERLKKRFGNAVPVSPRTLRWADQYGGGYCSMRNNLIRDDFECRCEWSYSEAAKEMRRIIIDRHWKTTERAAKP